MLTLATFVWCNAGPAKKRKPETVTTVLKKNCDNARPVIDRSIVLSGPLHTAIFDIECEFYLTVPSTCDITTVYTFSISKSLP